MNHFAYNVLTAAAAPLVKAGMALQPRYRPLLNRFRPELPEGVHRPIWVHACSVGELGVATPLLDALAHAYPDDDLLLTVSTISAWEMALSGRYGGRLAWFPVDQAGVARATVERFNPKALLLVETELWPNVIRAAANADVPVAVVNARISEKHFPRMQRMGALGRGMCGRLNLIAAQSPLYAERFASLGAKESAIAVTGNMKFDAVSLAPDKNVRDGVEAIAGLDQPILLFASTRPGDEALAARVWEQVRVAHPEMRLVVVPRHIDRADEIESLLPQPCVRRSQLDGPAPSDAAILVDTMGELGAWYSRAAVAVIGGSFYPGVQGHNLIEPCALKTPTVFGPYMRNFQDAADALVESGGALQVERCEDVADTLKALLADAPRRARMGEAAYETVIANRGAMEKTLELIAPFLA